MTPRTDNADFADGRATRPQPGRAPIAGATLIYGPKSVRPDLILAAQFLIDDLRAEGEQVRGVQVNSHTLRLKIEGAELALALSTGPLPARSLQGLRRPAGVHLLAGSGLDPDAADPAAGGAILTDLGTIRVMRALRQHRAALGVMLRRRGVTGPADLDALLQTMLLTLAEAAPPNLLLWQQSGLVFTGSEFAKATLAELNHPGGAAQLLPLPERFVPSPARDADAADPLSSTAPTDRAARAERRSAGRLFRRDGEPDATVTRDGPDRAPRVTILPRLASASGALAAALRDQVEAPARPARPTPRRFSIRMLLGLYFALILPQWSSLQAVLTL